MIKIDQIPNVNEIRSIIFIAYLSNEKRQVQNQQHRLHPSSNNKRFSSINNQSRYAVITLTTLTMLSRLTSFRVITMMLFQFASCASK